MATMILLPDGSSGHTFHWAVNTGTHEDALGSDDDDTSYVACSVANRYLTVTYANPSVAEEDIASIDSVRFLSSGRSTHRTTDSEVDILIANPLGNPAETVSYNRHASSYETINGTALPYSKPGFSTAWTYSDLENLSLRCIKNGSIEVRLSYLALEVTYTAAAVGYGNDVIGVDSGDISKINGIATANISKVNGV